jgi:hypothetical protein
MDKATKLGAPSINSQTIDLAVARKASVRIDPENRLLWR